MIMAFHHRKFLISETKKPHFSKKFNSDSCYLCYVCPENCYLSPPPPPPLQPSPRPELSVSTKNHIPIVLILMLCVLGVAFFILSYLTISRYRNSRRNVSPAPETLTANFADENRGPSLDHPIWFIRTVGLPQSLIDSIESFAYRKGEGLIDGNDCSVCLNDFRQNEMIRLLPKCTHAFHLDCIDTWLRSHKTCPVCRAPVVAVDRHQDVRVTSIESSPSSSNYLENRSEIEGNDEPIIIQVDGAIDDESRMQKLRVMSDVANRTRGIGSFDGDLQPVRRSVSMDLSHDSINYDVDQEECSDHTSLKIISRRVKRSSSFSGKRKSEKDRS